MGARSRVSTPWGEERSRRGRWLIALISTSLLCTPAATAAETLAVRLEDEILRSARRASPTTPHPSPDSSVAIVSQRGSTNWARIGQTGPGNLARHVQIGDGNQVELVQRGTGNTAVGEQVGYGNRLTQVQEGTGLEQRVHQTGSGMRAVIRQSN